jgi:hypothetical protein
MLSTAPVALCYGVRVVRVGPLQTSRVHLIWLGWLALGLAGLESLWGVLFLVLELVFPLKP